MKYRWACEACWDLKDAIEIAFDFPGGSLILHKGKYKILGGQGHADDEILTFSKKPLPEPPDGDSDEDCKKWFDWHRNVNRTKWNFDLDTSVRLYKSARKHGYRDGYLDRWLYNKAAKLIAEFEKKKFNTNGKTVKSFIAAYDYFINNPNDSKAYSQLSKIACKTRDINPLIVAEYMGKIPDPV